MADTPLTQSIEPSLLEILAQQQEGMTRARLQAQRKPLAMEQLQNFGEILAQGGKDAWKGFTGGLGAVNNAVNPEPGPARTIIPSYTNADGTVIPEQSVIFTPKQSPLTRYTPLLSGIGAAMGGQTWNEAVGRGLTGYAGALDQRQATEDRNAQLGATMEYRQKLLERDKALKDTKTAQETKALEDTLAKTTDPLEQYQLRLALAGKRGGVPIKPLALSSSKSLDPSKLSAAMQRVASHVRASEDQFYERRKVDREVVATQNPAQLPMFDRHTVRMARGIRDKAEVEGMQLFVTIPFGTTDGVRPTTSFPQNSRGGYDVSGAEEIDSRPVAKIPAPNVPVKSEGIGKVVPRTWGEAIADISGNTPYQTAPTTAEVNANEVQRQAETTGNMGVPASTPTPVPEISRLAPPPSEEMPPITMRGKPLTQKEVVQLHIIPPTEDWLIQQLETDDRQITFSDLRRYYGDPHGPYGFNAEAAEVIANRVAPQIEAFVNKIRELEIKQRR